MSDEGLDQPQAPYRFPNVPAPSLPGHPDVPNVRDALEGAMAKGKYFGAPWGGSIATAAGDRLHAPPPPSVKHELTTSDGKLTGAPPSMRQGPVGQGSGIFSRPETDYDRAGAWGGRARG
jgi:hypothetical protein